MMKIWLCLAASTLSLSASAKDNACLIRGEYTEDGQHEVVNSCATNKGMSDRDFKTACQGLLEAYRSDLSETSANKIAFKSVSSCPANSSGTCEGAFGYQLNLVFLEGDSMLKTVGAKQFCEAAEGKWKPR